MLNNIRHQFFKDKLEFTFNSEEMKLEVKYILKHIDYFKFEKLLNYIISESYKNDYNDFYEFINEIFLEIKITGKDVDEYKPSDIILLMGFFVSEIQKELSNLKKK